MAFNFEQLDEVTRKLMQEEANLDVRTGNLYISPRLNEHGKESYIGLLKQAFINGNEETFAQDLLRNRLFNPTYLRTLKNGKTTNVTMPINAHITLAEGEFNRYYIRAMCLRAITQGDRLVIYRAKEVAIPRPDSKVKIGTEVDPKTLLDYLRVNIGTDNALGIPPGPNSGLSVKIGTKVKE